MDENVVAVHMIETSDGTIQVLTDGTIDPNAEIIAASDSLNHLTHIQDSNEEEYAPEEVQEDQEEGEEEVEEEEEQDVKMHYQLETENQLEEEEAVGEEEEEEAQEESFENHEQIQEAEGDDIIIAEAVVVTQYSCKFCNRRFETIDKVKNHYLQKHNKDQNLAQRFAGQLSATDEESEESQKKKLKPNPSKPKPTQYLKVISAVDESKSDLKKKRRPAPVVRKYPCDWPGCNYIARHSVLCLIQSSFNKWFSGSPKRS